MNLQYSFTHLHLTYSRFISTAYCRILNGFQIDASGVLLTEDSAIVETVKEMT